METTTAPAALLIFTLGASREGRRRRLLPEAHGEQELALHQECLDLAFAAGRANDCRLLVSSPGVLEVPTDATLLGQQGFDFGERLAGAASEAQEISSGPLVVLGSDVPDIEPRHVAEALDLLAEDRDSVVIGPSPDGGLYLLASHRPLGHLLARVSWCRRDTRRRLVRALRNAGLRVTFLEPVRDLDKRADLERWLSDATEFLGASLRELTRRVQSILGDLRRPLAPTPVLLRARRCRGTATGRAPPSLH